MIGSFFSIAGRALVASVFLCSAGLALAEENVTITNVWAKSTAPGQTVAAAYLDILSKTTAALVGAESPAAKVVELHEMTLDGNIMRMRPVPRIDLPAGKRVKLEPGGLHVMLIDIQQPLRVGDKVPLTLTIEADGRTEKMNVTADVMDAKGGHHHH